jgi:23S rRNA (uracil1939-C5)-methyltransferase
MPEEYTVRVRSLAFGGRGIARLDDGKTLFIDAAVPGDLLKVEPGQDHGRYQEATISEIIEASDSRQAPDCPYHDRCGACSLQHIRAEALREYKRSFVVDALARIGGIKESGSLVARTKQGGQDWHYRNKIELNPVVEKGRLRLGFSAQKSHEVVPVDSCLLLPRPYGDLPSKLSGALSYVLKGNEQALKRVSVRVAQNCKDVELALWTEPGPMDRAFVAKVLGDTLKTSSTVRVLIRGAVEKRDIRNVEALSGKGFWQERIGGFSFKVSAPSFFQTNSRVAEMMVEEVLAWMNEQLGAAKDSSAQIIDLYCGVGTFTLPLAEHFDNVVGIEAAGSSVRDLRRNLDENELYAGVMGGSVEYLLPNLRKAAHIVVDPPRAGLSDKARSALIAAEPRSIAYVSCDPSTLARDIKALKAAGYDLVSVTPFDMFPQTYHVETIAYLIK